MRYLNTLAAYVPSLIVSHCIDDENKALPQQHPYETVVMFCDVSGFTRLSEAMALSGRGAEGLKKHLNSYFAQMNKIISSNGGDIFKFAGDAMIVLWPPSDEAMETRCQRAAQAAILIQNTLHKAQLEEDVELSVKIGLGVGKCSVLLIGGHKGRVEYVAVGDPLQQAFAAEAHCAPGDVFCSTEAWRFVQKHFKAAEKEQPEDGFVRLDNNKAAFSPIVLTSIAKFLDQLIDSISEDPTMEAQIEARLRSYIPESVLPSLQRGSEVEKWANELRSVVIMFVNLGLSEQDSLDATRYDEALHKVHRVLLAAQKAIYKYSGTVNKFLFDDKGSTLIANFGLPPHESAEDPVRGVLAALELAASLRELGLAASIGITVGEVFCGITGSIGRKEYTVLGDSVNLSARLMQKAGEFKDDSERQTGGIIIDAETYRRCNGCLAMISLGQMRVKGKSMPIDVYQPYPYQKKLTSPSDPAPQSSFVRSESELRGRVSRSSSTVSRSSSASSVVDENFFAEILDYQLSSLAASKGLQAMDRALLFRGGLPSMPGMSASANNRNLLLPATGRQLLAAAILNQENSAFDYNSNPLILSPSGSRAARSGFFKRSAMLLNRRLNLKKGQPTTSPMLETESSRAAGDTATLLDLTTRKRAESGGSSPTALSTTTTHNPGALPWVRRRRSTVDAAMTHAQIVIPGELVGARHARLNAEGDLPSIAIVVDNTLPSVESNDATSKSPSRVPKKDPPEHVKPVVTTERMPEFCTNFLELRDRVHALALAEGLVEADAPAREYVFLIAATKTVLPVEAVCGMSDPPPMRRLSAYAAAAFGSELKMDNGDEVATTVPLVLAHLDDLVDRRLSRLAGLRQGLLERKMALVDGDCGSFTLLEAESGCGKTTALGHFVGSCLRRTAPTVYVVVEPFARKRLAPWAALLRQLVAVFGSRSWKVAQTKEKSVEELQRATVLELVGSDVRLAGAMLKLLYGRGGEDVAELDAADVYAALARIGESFCVVLLIDDAHHLDEESWNLCALLAQRPPARVMCVVSMRALARDGICSSTTVSKSPYGRTAQYASMMKLGALEPDELADLIMEIAGPRTSSISEALRDHVASLSRSVPLIAKELVQRLLSQKPAPTVAYLDTWTDTITLTYPQNAHDIHVMLAYEAQLDEAAVAAAAAAEPNLGASSPVGVAVVSSSLEGEDSPTHRSSLETPINMSSLIGGAGVVVVSPSTAAAAGAANSRLRRASRVVGLNASRAAHPEKEGKEDGEDAELGLGGGVKFPKPSSKPTPKVTDVLLEKLNGCSSRQVLLLKHAALLRGIEFKWETLLSAYCVNDDDEALSEEFQDLVERGLIDSTEIVSDSVDDKTVSTLYSLAHGELMALSLERRMLADDRRLVTERIQRERTLIENRRMEQFLAKMNELEGLNREVRSRSRLFEGELSIRRNIDRRTHVKRADPQGPVARLGGLGAGIRGIKNTIQSGWKERYCTLDGLSLRMFRSLDDLRFNSEGPTQEILMEDCVRATFDKESDSGDPAFWIEVSGYLKHGKMVREQRYFIVRSHPTCRFKQNDIDAWISTLAFVIARTKKLRAQATLKEHVREARPIQPIQMNEREEPPPPPASSPSPTKKKKSIVGRMLDVVSTPPAAKHKGVLSKQPKVYSQSWLKFRGDGEGFQSALEAGQHQADVGEQLRLALETEWGPPATFSPGAAFRLVVVCDACADMYNHEAHTTPHRPLISLVVNGVRMKPCAPMAGGTESSPYFGVAWSLDVSLDDWATRTLRLEIRDDIPLMTPDLIGFVELQLSALQIVTTSAQECKGLDVPIRRSHRGYSLKTACLPQTAKNKDAKEPIRMGDCGAPNGRLSLGAVIVMGAEAAASISGAGGASRVLESIRVKSESAQNLMARPSMRRSSLIRASDQQKKRIFRLATTIDAAQAVLGEATRKISGTSPKNKLENKCREAVLETHLAQESLWEEDEEGQQLPVEDEYGYAYMVSDFEKSSPCSLAELKTWRQAGLLHDQVQVVVNGNLTPLPVLLKHGGLKGEALLSVSEDGNQPWALWEFDIWRLKSDRSLRVLAECVCSRLRVCERLDAPQRVVRRFLANVGLLMRRRHNAYHNFRHAIDVVQSCFAMCFDGDDTTDLLAQKFTELEMISLIIAAMVHDLDHPGRSNAFLIATADPVALRYHDVSVLEHMHCALLWESLTDPRADITANLGILERRQLKETWVAAILATDLATHKVLQASLTALLPGDPFEVAHKRRTVIIPALLHASDISNAAKPWAVSKKWSDALLVEFFLQGDAEKAAGLPVSKFMDRNDTKQPILALSFIDYFAAPIYATLETIHAPFKKQTTALAENRATWVQVRDNKKNADGTPKTNRQFSVATATL